MNAMKIVWQDILNKSIATSPCGYYHLLVYKDLTSATWSALIYPQTDAGISTYPAINVGGLNRQTGKEACEKWLSDQDKPAWKETELSACATWHGWSIVIRASVLGFAAEAHNPTLKRCVVASGSLMSDAQANIVAEIRRARGQE